MTSRDERADINAALRGEGHRPPKRVKSWRTCPRCGSRATKMFHLSAADDECPLHCQVCDHRYNPPTPLAVAQDDFEIHIVR